MEAEERLGRDMPHDEEIALLKRESEMSVEELKAMYEEMSGDQEEDSNANTEDSNHSESSSHEMQVEDDDDAGASTKRKRQRDDNDVGAKKSRQETPGEGPDDGLAALTALEASAERARNTLATRPFLLSSWVKLRLYQHTGLNWLVSLQSRRLNGILADGKSY
jgi:E1A-binding protein p400